MITRMCDYCGLISINVHKLHDGYYHTDCKVQERLEKLGIPLKDISV